MFVNGEIRFSDENLMDLFAALTLAMDQIDTLGQNLTVHTIDMARELEKKAEAFLSLSETIETTLLERIGHGYE